MRDPDYTLFYGKVREKTLFSVFSRSAGLVAGRVETAKSDQMVTFCPQKVTKGDKKRTFSRLLSELGWFNEGSG